MRTKEPEHKPSFSLEQIALPCVMNPLSERRMKLQAVRVQQNSAWSRIGEIRASDESSPTIIEFVLFEWFRESSRVNRSQQCQLQR